MILTMTALGGLAPWSRWQFIGAFGVIEAASGLANVISPNIWRLPIAELQTSERTDVKLAGSALLLPHWGGLARSAAGVVCLAIAAWQEGLLDPQAMELTLIFQSADASGLFRPDNLTVAPTEDLFICEDTGGDVVPHIRALTPDGFIYDFARAGRGGLQEGTNLTEFCGTCFSSVPHPEPRSGGLDLSTLTLYANQQGAAAASGAPAVTYAIWGPWKRD